MVQTRLLKRMLTRGAGALEVIVAVITTFGFLIYTNSSITFGAIIYRTIREKPK
jgi:hypothetical protein